MTKKHADWAKEESAGDTDDILKRLEEAARNDKWCELSGYSASLLWQHIEKLRRAVHPGECRCTPMAPRSWKFCQDCGGRIPENT